MRICLRDDVVYDKFAQQYPNIGTNMVDKMNRWNNSPPIISESVAAIRNFVRKPEYAKLMRPESIDILINLARDARFDKVRPVIGQSLKLMQKIPEFEQRIRVLNGTDLL